MLLENNSHSMSLNLALFRRVPNTDTLPLAQTGENDNFIECLQTSGDD